MIWSFNVPFISINKEGIIMRTKQFSKSLSVALPQEHYAMVKQITDEEQISMAEWVREAVAAALTTNQPKEEQMND
jgi:tartrate dehydratase alpha subunit/fumarate hydratase class I-like protein